MAAAVLGIFRTAEDAARAMDYLRARGFRSHDLEVLTDSPYPEGAFGEEPPRHHLYVFPVVGAACGLIVGLLLTIAVQLAYPMVQGGKPLLSIPPMINILYEGTLLGAIVLTVAGVLFESRLPDFSGDPYDPRIAEGFIGILATRLNPGAVDAAEQTLRETGALDIIVKDSP